MRSRAAEDRPARDGGESGRDQRECVAADEADAGEELAESLPALGEGQECAHAQHDDPERGEEDEHAPLAPADVDGGGRGTDEEEEQERAEDCKDALEERSIAEVNCAEEVAAEAPAVGRVLEAAHDREKHGPGDRESDEGEGGAERKVAAWIRSPARDQN